MSLLPQDQFRHLLIEAKDVLIFLPDNPGFDAIGSAWALSFFLENRGVSTTLVSNRTITDQKFAFLPSPKKIVSEISGAREFVLSFDTSRNKIAGLRQETVGDRFNVYLTPEKGSIDPRDFSFILAKFKYDLIIVLDSPDLESLGRIYVDNSDLFFEVPVVNIDHRGNNENFGQLNLVDLTASSCAEIVKASLENIDASGLNKDIATCLLAGIIGATGNFQRKNTTPRALLAAAELMDRGADQQGIIRWLYKTQPLSILKLLGRVMSKLNWEEKTKLAWSALTLDDFVQSRTTPENLPVILEKLQENYSEGQFFMLAWNDTPTSSLVLIKCANSEALPQLSHLFGVAPEGELLRLRSNDGDPANSARAIYEKLDSLRR